MNDTNATPFIILAARDPERIRKTVEDIEEAFGEVLVKHFPEAETGDFGPSESFALTEAITSAVRTWVMWNVDGAETICRDHGNVWGWEDRALHAFELGVLVTCPKCGADLAAMKLTEGTYNGTSELSPILDHLAECIEVGRSAEQTDAE